MLIVRDFIGAIVSKMEFDSNEPKLSKAPEYVSGNKTIVERVLSSKIKDNSIRKYPLVVLQTPIKETDIKLKFTELTIENARLLIVMNTDFNKWTDARYRENFKPILYPILLEFERLMKKYSQSFEIVSKQDVEFSLQENENTIIDKWDYIEVLFNATIDENCLMASI